MAWPGQPFPLGLYLRLYPMKLLIKHIVCARCIRVVKMVADRFPDLPLEAVGMGYVELKGSLDAATREAFNAALLA